MQSPSLSTIPEIIAYQSLLIRLRPVFCPCTVVCPVCLNRLSIIRSILVPLSLKAVQLVTRSLPQAFFILTPALRCHTAKEFKLMRQKLSHICLMASKRTLSCIPSVGGSERRKMLSPGKRIAKRTKAKVLELRSKRIQKRKRWYNQKIRESTLKKKQRQTVDLDSLLEPFTGSVGDTYRVGFNDSVPVRDKAAATSLEYTPSFSARPISKKMSKKLRFAIESAKKVPKITEFFK